MAASAERNAFSGQQFSQHNARRLHLGGRAGVLGRRPDRRREDRQEAEDGGFKEAIEDDIAKFEARWPKGTREYLALTLFL